MLRECGVEDPALLALVKWHDTSLPWYLAQTKGQPPSDKAWLRRGGPAGPAPRAHARAALDRLPEAGALPLVNEELRPLLLGAPEGR